MATEICQDFFRISKLRLFCGAASLWLGLSAAAWSAPFPAKTILPVSFATTIEAGKAKVNDPVRGHTLQTVILPDGTKIPKGTVLVGHITESLPFHFDPAPYAAQKRSLLGIHFDRIELKNGSLPVTLEVRAVAGAYAVDDASRPFNATELQMTGPMLQVGGDSYWPPDMAVRSHSGDIVAYVRKEGIFARPLASAALNAEPGLECDAIGQEQAVSVFSAGACGLYGLTESVLESNGSDGSGTFVLASNRTSVFLLAHSAVLLEVMP